MEGFYYVIGKIFSNVTPGDARNKKCLNHTGKATAPAISNSNIAQFPGFIIKKYLKISKEKGKYVLNWLVDH